MSADRDFERTETEPIAAEPTETAATARTAALEAAMKGVGVVWLSPEAGAELGEAPYTTGPLWHVWTEGTCYLLTGPGEQPVPGIIPGRLCRVTARGAAGGRTITWTASVEVLDPGSSQWARVAPKLAANRLNGGDPVAVLPTWPGRLTILSLRPTGQQDTSATGLPDDGEAAVPIATPATTPYRMPSDITRRWRRRWDRKA